MWSKEVVVINPASNLAFALFEWHGAAVFVQALLLEFTDNVFNVGFIFGGMRPSKVLGNVLVFEVLVGMFVVFTAVVINDADVVAESG